jgi:hypothetical protein
MRRLASAALALSLLGIFWSGYARVKPTNFSGHDEWLVLWLDAKGVLGFPYANRPLALFWSSPLGALLDPSRVLTGYWMANGLYLSLVGLVVLGIGRRMLPSAPLLVYLAAVVAAVWAPTDSSRLDTVAMTGPYSGNALAVFVAGLVFVESWRRSSLPLLASALCLAVVAVRANEATLPLLAGVPLALLALERRSARATLLWAGAWSLVMAAAVLVAIRPVIWPAEGSYQASALGFDPHPLRVAERMLQLYAYHLGPLFSPLAIRASAASVVLALAAFVVGFGVLAGTHRGRATPRQLVGTVIAGAVASSLAYLPYALTPSVRMPLRTQMLSTPGVGFLVAGIACALAQALPTRSRAVAVALVGGWVVAGGTGRVVAMQREWDAATAWPVQSATMRDLVRLAPDLRPNTFILLFDDTGRWPATFTFRHAVDYVYGGRAIGAVWGAHPFLYPFAFTKEGLVSDPWPAIRKPWGVKPSLHAYHEIVAARLGSSGVEILPRWPEEVLPPLPPGAAYDPEARIVPGGAALRGAILAAR